MAFLTSILRWALKAVFMDVLTAVYSGVKKYIEIKREEARIKKEVAAKVEDINREKDPIVRAKRMRDFLSSRSL